MCCSSRAKFLLTLSCLAAAGCSGVGEGTQPTGIMLGGPSGESSVDVAECSIFNLYAYIEINDELEDGADFSSRVSWSSDNPTVADVSNSDIAPDGTNDGSVYQSGVVIARQPGAATIRAEYLDFSATIPVNVSELNGIEIIPSLTRIAEGTSQEFILQGYVAGSAEPQNLGSNAIWSFTAPTTNMVLQSSSSGVVTAGDASSSPNELEARLAECGRSASITLFADTPTGYRVDYDNGDNPLLPLDYSEAFSVWAEFSNGEAQNLSNQASTDLEDDDPLQALLATSSEPGQERILVYAYEETSNDSFELTLPGIDTVNLQSKAWTVTEQDLEAISSPQTEWQLVFPDTAQLQVMGLFEDGNYIDISRHVSWTSSDESLLIVSNAAADAGLITGSDLRASVDVEAQATQNADLSVLSFDIELQPAD